MKWELYPIFAQEAYTPLRGELQELCDALSLGDSEMVALAERVKDFPVAAIIFLQLLRHNEHCLQQHRGSDALLAESLAYSALQGSVEFKRWLALRPATPHVAVVYEQEPVLLQRDDNLLAIRFNRPQARNAYSSALRDALYEALLLLDQDSTIERCVIDGEGDCFCVGGDLSEFGLATDPAYAHVVRMARSVPFLLMKHATRIECHVHRACMGSGIELPAFAGKLLATQDTFFQLPELSMGLIPGAGGTVSILKRIGRHRLAWWVLSGKKIKAETALQWGLVDAVIDRSPPAQ
jgi:enoyl-CoA hydratase/carnithine racemase